MKTLVKCLLVVGILLLPAYGWAANTKISDETAKGVPAAADQTIIVDSADGANKVITLGTIPGIHRPNLFPNHNFDRWKTGTVMPDYWDKPGTTTWTKCGINLSNTTHHATYFSAKLACTAEVNPSANFYSDFIKGTANDVVSALYGQTATLAIWIMPGSGQTFSDPAYMSMSLQVDVPPWMPNRTYTPGEAVCSNFLYLHPTQNDLALATPGLFIRGVTSGAWGLITKRDDTNKYIYLDRLHEGLAFATGETLKLTTNGKASGDTGISFTNEATNGYYTITQKSMFVTTGRGISGATEPTWDDQHGDIPQTDNTVIWRYYPNKVDTLASQPAYDPILGWQVGVWRNFYVSLYIPTSVWQVTPSWIFKPSNSGTGTFYLAEPTLCVGSSPITNPALPATQEAATYTAIGGVKISKGTALPADGSWCNQGDLFIMTNAAAGGVPIYYCTTAGTAGGSAVWKPFANIGS
jgi:hypothetical protein